MGVTTARRTDKAGRRAEAAGYHRSWFPVALASEVVSGRPVGRHVLGTRVALYPDDDRRPGRRAAATCWVPAWSSTGTRTAARSCRARTARTSARTFRWAR